MGEGEGEGGGKPGDSGFSAPKPGASVGVEKKFGSKETSVSTKKPAASSEGDKGEKGEGEKKEGASKKVTLGPVYKKEVKGEVWSSKKEGSDDKAFVTVLEGKASIEALSASVDLGKKSAKVTVVEASAEVTGVHGEVDLVDKIKHLLFGEDKKPTPPPAPTVPMAARVGDLTMHLGPLTPGPGSSNVFIGGKPAWRVGLDVHLCPAPGVPHGGGPTAPGALTVLINGAPAARATDFVVEPTGGPDVIAIGFPTVLIGPATPPPPPAPPPPPSSDDLPWVKFESTASGDVVKLEGKANIEAEGDLSKRSGKVQAEVGVMAALLKGEIPLKIRVRIPFTSYYAGLGVKVEGTLISAGASANAQATVNEGDTLFDASAGAKAGVGLGGVGAKVSVDVSK